MAYITRRYIIIPYCDKVTSPKPEDDNLCRSNPLLIPTLKKHLMKYSACFVYCTPYLRMTFQYKLPIHKTNGWRQCQIAIMIDTIRTP